jgi:hypothetical protein
VRSYAKYLKLHHACVIMNATVKRIINNEKKKSKKSFPDMSGDGKVTKKDILMRSYYKKNTHITKDGRVARKGLYYYMNRAKKLGKSKPGKGTVSDKALKASAKTAKK